MATTKTPSMRVLANGDIVDCTRLPTSARNTLYKTELCKHFMDTGTCRYGNKCQFAHGEHELRGVLRHPKYKTTMCKAYATEKKCQYGNRCRFIHEDINGSAIDVEQEMTDDIRSSKDEARVSSVMAMSPKKNHVKSLADEDKNERTDSQEICLRNISFKGLAPISTKKDAFGILSGIDYASFAHGKSSLNSHILSPSSAADVPIHPISNFDPFKAPVDENPNGVPALTSSVSRLSIFQNICKPDGAKI